MCVENWRHKLLLYWCFPRWFTPWGVHDFPCCFEMNMKKQILYSNPIQAFHVFDALVSFANLHHQFSNGIVVSRWIGLNSDQPRCGKQ